MDQLALSPRPFLQRKLVQLIARGFFLSLLIVPVTMNLPKVIQHAHATDWSTVEDCDGDGKDDVTGLAVPWAGFDGTRGDTPAGPGTAAWWIAQQSGSGSSGSGSSGSSGSSSDSGSSSSSGSSGSKSGASSSSGSSGSSTKAAKSTVVTTKATAAAQPAATAVAAPAATRAIATPVASIAATASAATTQSAASAASTVAPVAATTPEQGAPAGGSANSLWAALTVGFTSENKELYAGLGLLAALALLGGLAVGVSGLRDVSAYAQSRRRELQYAEEPAASSA